VTSASRLAARDRVAIRAERIYLSPLGPSSPRFLPARPARGSRRKARPRESRGKFDFRAEPFWPQETTLANFPNPVEEQFGQSRRFIRLAFGAFLFPVAAFVAASLTGNVRIGALGIFLLIFASIFALGFYGRARTARRVTPISMELEVDRMAFHWTPESVPSGAPTHLSLKFGQVARIHPTELNDRSDPAFVVLTLNLSQGERNPRARASRDGSGLVRLFLTRENLAHLRAAYDSWTLAHGLEPTAAPP
jgi:hypothetical protein